MLARPYRLAKTRDFSLIYKRGKRFSGSSLSLAYLKSNQNTPRFGFVVSTKQVRKIVDRNRLKRILRAETRELLPRMKPGVDVVVQGRRGADKATPAQIREDLRSLLTKANLLQK
ncbi:MAG: ribonuclease P protein component [bacterium]|nr:ribonuclease P protein component [bacterium]